MPNVLIDAKEGLMWKLKLRLESGKSKEVISDLPRLVGFLQQRVVSLLILNVAKSSYCSRTQANTLTSNETHYLAEGSLTGVSRRLLIFTHGKF